MSASNSRGTAEAGRPGQSGPTNACSAWLKSPVETEPGQEFLDAPHFAQIRRQNLRGETLRCLAPAAVCHARHFHRPDARGDRSPELAESRGWDELKKSAYLGLILVIRRTPPCQKLSAVRSSFQLALVVMFLRRFFGRAYSGCCPRQSKRKSPSRLLLARTSSTLGRRQVAHNGRLPERSITTGVGQVEIEQPRVHDRRAAAEREKFGSRLLPPQLRKTKSMMC